MSIILNFTFRHLFRHWRLNLVVLLVMTLTAALLAGLPTYATMVAARSLRAALEDADPAARNLAILAGRGYQPNAALVGDVLEPIEALLVEQMEIRNGRVAAQANPYGLEGGTQVGELQLWSFSRMTERLRVVEGRLPSHWEARTQTEKLQPPKAEAVIGVEVAARVGLRVGDVLLSVAENEFTIVGLVEPLNPWDEVWFGDATAMFALGLRAQDINTDIAIVPLIISSRSMKDYFSFHTASTRIILDHTQINVNTVDAVQQVLADVQSVMSASNLRLTTGLDVLLAHYEAQLVTARVTLFLLTAQAVAFALYTLGMMAVFLQERSANALHTLVGRGSGREQLTLVFALEALMLALPSAVLGPVVAYGVSRVWLQSERAVLLQGIPAEAWHLALIAVGFAWVVR